MTKVASVIVCAPVYVPAGEILDGSALDSGAWVRPGEPRRLSLDFAESQERAGLLEVVAVDGAPVVRATCCGNHSD